MTGKRQNGLRGIGAAQLAGLAAGGTGSLKAVPGTEFAAISSPADLGQLVRQAREERKLSQQDFADLAGVGRRFLSELENGKATLELGKVLKVLQAAGFDLFAGRR
jgi:y4mF family transcriptional regulator